MSEQQNSSLDVPLGRIVLVAATAALGGFLFGFDTAVINGAVGAIGERFGVSGFLLGFAVASALIGCAIGAWYAGPVADRLGRIKVMIIAAVLFVVSSIGCAAAFSVWDLSLWRAVGGLGVGAASIIAPAYIAEVSPAGIRGRLGSLQQLAIVSGIFVALLTAYALVAAAGSATATLFGIEAWRLMFLAELIPAVVYGVLAFTIPESPRFLIYRGQRQRALKVLHKYVGGDVERTADEIERSFQGRTERPKLSVLRGPSRRIYPIVWAGLGLAILQQFTGINVIFYYSSVLWQAVGFTEQDSLIITVITSVTNILTTVVAIVLIDKVGRKPLLLVGSIGQFASLAVLAITFATAPVVNGEPLLQGAASPVALIAANLFVVFFGCTWGPIMWVMLGEMFPNKIRAMALAVAGAAQWAANFVVSTTFPALSEAGLGLAYGVYTFFAFVSIFFVIKFIQETKGETLEALSERDG
ncbi:sugar porter family MFS transporter [Rothia sp. AR01]|uniref:Sugar porter family MFS transporter n=1 Tax=Rothia santali TaxID=2949643 RepID=A0A9X2KH50_9MICC|nr:sugar porter family MFS transporter [Rothia santali]MCP3424465.1 sugar porter family MFS transporter [Rothia santali]